MDRSTLYKQIDREEYGQEYFIYTDRQRGVWIEVHRQRERSKDEINIYTDRQRGVRMGLIYIHRQTERSKDEINIYTEFDTFKP